jgi:DNA-directed RNA polymerase specialized sigma subunit
MLPENLVPFLDRLPAEQRQVVLLYFHNNLTKKQVLEQLKISRYKFDKLLSQGMYELRSLSGDPNIAQAKEIMKISN